jgi:hypothetical protein
MRREKTILVLIESTLYEISLTDAVSLEEHLGKPDLLKIFFSKAKWYARKGSDFEPEVEILIDKSGATWTWENLIDHAKDLSG